LFVALGMMACCVPRLPAQDYFLEWTSLNGSGGQSGDGTFQLSFTLGQPDAGVFTNGDLVLLGGFWSAGEPLCPPLPANGGPLVLINGQCYSNHSATVIGSAVVELRTAFDNEFIFYTLDGSDPDAGAFYTRPFVVNQSVLIRAVAWAEDFLDAAEAQPPFTLTVLKPPFIVSQPQSQLRAVGDTAVFGVEAGGSAPLAFQWRRDGLSLQGATNASLALSNLQLGQAGAYSVVVANPAGVVTSDAAVLTVLSPPGIGLQPAGTNVAPGSTVTFTVTPTGGGPFSFQWRKNGVNIPGATRSSLTLVNVGVADGGSYDVLVANPVRVTNSLSVTLTILGVSTVVAAADFADRTSLVTPPFGVTNCLRGTNLNAGREAGEPLHAGRHGSNSVWFTWRAPGNGIATFNTAGSAFDTLLAVYTGTSLSNLTRVASDDDSGGYVTSFLQFNARAGVDYHVAVDGFAANQGVFLLCWAFEPTNDLLPVILTQPASNTVMIGHSSLVLSVGVANVGLSYQWFHNLVPIPGANGSELLLTNVQPSNVGAYSVRVTTGTGRSVESEPAFVEIGPFPGVLSLDKIEDALALTAGGGGGGGGGALAAMPEGFHAASVGQQGVIVLRAGDIGAHYFNNTVATTQTNEPPSCAIGGYSRWFVISSEHETDCALSALSDSVPVQLGVFEGNYLDRPVACAATNAANGLGATVKFRLRPNTYYLVVIDGVDGARGLIQLAWALDGAVLAGDSGLEVIARRGGKATLGIATNSSLARATYQWLHEQTPLARATNFTLTLTNVQPAQAGRYAIHIHTGLSELTNVVARLRVETNLVVLTQSTFDTDAEGWTLRPAPPRPFSLIHSNRGGNPGGFILTTNLGANSWAWTAPPAFHGGFCAAYDGWLEFDLYRSGGVALADTLGVELGGGGLTLQFQTNYYPRPGWTSLKLKLKETVAGWTVPPNVRSPTSAEMGRVLHSLTNLTLTIRAGSTTPSSQNLGLDNVSLVSFALADRIQLNIEPVTAAVVRLSWFAPTECFQLEFSTNLATGSWQLEPNVQILSGANEVLYPVSRTQRFFRLSLRKQ
jgi:hypothetical protein